MEPLEVEEGKKNTCFDIEGTNSFFTDNILSMVVEFYKD